jgi:tripartite-type tricarboxylate transporter receptor subunit TctC
MPIDPETNMPRLPASLVALASFAVSAIVSLAPAAAQTYPDRPVRVNVGFAAGSASDVVYRIVLEKAAVLMGKPNIFVFENMPGAGGNNGLAAVKRAEPDGYTIAATAGGPLTVNKWLFKSLPFDPDADFEPITLLTVNPIVVAVSAKAPFKTLKELTAYAKANPDKITYSSVGPGSGQHLAGVQFEMLNGVKMRHLPYRITGQLVTDLITGEVPVSFQNIINVLEQARAGQVNLLALAAKQRHPSVPQTQTTAEAGMPAFLSNSWFAIVAPKGTPRPVIDTLNKAAVAALKDPETIKKLQDIGTEPTPMTPGQFKDYIAAESKSWREIVEKSGLPKM